MKPISSLVSRVQHYLDEVLGVPMSKPREWEGQDALPYHLRDSFEFRQLDILGTRLLLALDRHPGQAPLGEIRTRLDKVRSVASYLPIYVTDALASYERKRLIEQKVSFIVPGNQLYLPELGIDLREYFRHRVGSPESPLSPSAQAMLITALLRPRWESEWHPAEVATSLGYTPMTLSRVVREIAAAGLAQADKAGRTHYLSMTYSAQKTWERASPLLRSPVRKILWVRAPIRVDPRLRLAGLSALSHYSMLDDPRLPVYAVNRATWRDLNTKVEELHEAMPGAQVWQLWSYGPALQLDSQTVDPLSLMLSLRDSADERIQSALDALQEQLPW
jgi:DNA-binding MarR family transcriptional regulator